MTYPTISVQTFAFLQMTDYYIYQLNQTMTLLSSKMISTPSVANNLNLFNHIVILTYKYQIHCTLNWTAQCNSVTRKAQQTLGVIRRIFNKCPTHSKPIAYTTLVRPILKYPSASWDPHCLKHIKTLERIQRQAAKFCTQNYSREPGTITQLLKNLQWDTLQTRRRIKRLDIIYKM